MTHVNLAWRKYAINLCLMKKNREKKMCIQSKHLKPKKCTEILPDYTLVMGKKYPAQSLLKVHFSSHWPADHQPIDRGNATIQYF